MAAAMAAASSGEAGLAHLDVRPGGTLLAVAAHGRDSVIAMADLLVFPQETVLRAIDPAEAIERVRDGFVEYAGNEWQMPPKVYLDASPNGDFRAMPAKGAGLAILKWVTSFPRNPEAGLPVVMGMICVSSVANGEPLALVDVRSVTALRTGAVAAVAAQELAREDARSVGMSAAGCTGPGRHAASRRPSTAPGMCFDPDPEAAGKLAGELGWEVGHARGGARLRHRDLRDARPRAGHLRERPAARPPPEHAGRRRLRARRRPSRRPSRAASSSATTGPRRATAASSPPPWRPGS